jgi:hypothetical protein
MIYKKYSAYLCFHLLLRLLASPCLDLQQKVRQTHNLTVPVPILIRIFIHVEQIKQVPQATGAPRVPYQLQIRVTYWYSTVPVPVHYGTDTNIKI